MCECCDEFVFSFVRARFPKIWICPALSWGYGADGLFTARTHGFGLTRDASSRRGSRADIGPTLRIKCGTQHFMRESRTCGSERGRERASPATHCQQLGSYTATLDGRISRVRNRMRNVAPVDMWRSARKVAAYAGWPLLTAT
jgi:hypothetical protein